jgi:hypothetical protein
MLIYVICYNGHVKIMLEQLVIFETISQEGIIFTELLYVNKKSHSLE